MDNIIALDAFDDPSEATGEVRPDESFDIVQALSEMVMAPNLTDMLPAEKLGQIATVVLDEFNIDEASREEWMAKATKGVELASMVSREKSYPFEGCSNVKVPLVAQAAMQFNARATPALIPSDDIVKMPVNGKDQSGRKAARAERVSSFMSYYLRKKMPEWIEETDKLLVQLPIVGQMFRKIWYDPARKICRSRLLGPDIVVVNQATKNISDAPRISEKLFLYPNEISERERAKIFREFDYTGYSGERDDDTVVTGEVDAQDDTLAPQEFIEQHRWLDLDDDGYAEPYVVTVHKESRTVVRVVANFTPDGVLFTDGTTLEDAMGQQQAALSFVASDREVASIKRRDYYVSYRFFPPFDGGFYGIGLGYLLGTHSDAVDSIINMLIDTGHRNSMGGGFIGQGLNMRKSEVRFKPGEFKNINAAGANIRDAIVPLTFPEPSPTLFQLLGLLIDMGREVASVTEVMTGDASTQTQPTTLLALIDQGMAVFSAAFKRIHMAMTNEFSLLAKLMSLTPDEEGYAEFHDVREMQQQAMQAAIQQGISPEQAMAAVPQIRMAADFNMSDMDIEPSADPRSVTRPQQMAQAEVVLQMARNGELPRDRAIRRVLEASNIPDVDSLMPTPEEAQAAAQAQQQAMQVQQQLAAADIAAKQASAQHDGARAQAIQAELQIKQTKTGSEVSKTDAEIAKIGAEIQKMRAEMMRGDDPLAAPKLELEARKLTLDARKAELELLNAEAERAHGERTQRVEFDKTLAAAGFAPGTTPERAGESVQQVMQAIARNEEAQRRRDEQMMRQAEATQAALSQLIAYVKAPTRIDRDENGRAVQGRKVLEGES